MASNTEVSLAGSNEDSEFPLTLIWYVPASKGEYGRVCLGYNMMKNSAQGGMNEKGLFVDGNSLGKQGWESEKAKETHSGSVLDRLLATCANIEDAKAFFHNYNVPALDSARIPIMDKSGASMIVEWHRGAVAFLESDEPYQVATNFVGSDYIGRDKPCWRYNKAIESLKIMGPLTVDTIRDALNATHVEGSGSTTVYSFICNLTSGDIHIYNYHDYSQALIFNLGDELFKGAHEHYLGNLFAQRTAAYEEFILDGPVRMIERGYERNISVALLFYNLLKINYPKAFQREIGIETLSHVGRRRAEEGNLADAIKFLELNVREFPDSAEAHYELGRVYSINQQTEDAIREYEKSLIIDEKHIQAKKALEELR